MSKATTSSQLELLALKSANYTDKKVAELGENVIAALEELPNPVRYDEPQTLTEAQKERARKNIAALGEADISLGIASDGLIYIFVNGLPVGTGIPQGQSGDIHGYIDENKHIVLSGNLPDGTYTASYEDENGSIVALAGQLVKDTNVYYPVASNLTNCTNSNGTKTVVEGESYSATITANEGYELSSVVVTMGGSPVTVTDGVINIASVTGDIVITAVAEEVASEPVNWLNEVGYSANTRIRASNGATQELTDVEATGFIPFKYGDTIYLKDISLVDSGNNSVAVYNANKEFISGNYMAAFLSGVTAGSGADVNGGLVSQTLNISTWISSQGTLTESSPVAFIRFSANEITENSIVTVNEPIV